MKNNFIKWFFLVIVCNSLLYANLTDDSLVKIESGYDKLINAGKSLVDDIVARAGSYQIEAKALKSSSENLRNKIKNIKSFADRMKSDIDALATLQNICVDMNSDLDKDLGVDFSKKKKEGLHTSKVLDEYKISMKKLQQEVVSTCIGDLAYINTQTVKLHEEAINLYREADLLLGKAIINKRLAKSLEQKMELLTTRYKVAMVEEK